MTCRCPINQQALVALPPIDARAVVVEHHPNIPGHARTYIPGPYRIQVTGAWFRSLLPEQKMAVIAHEVAHHEEGCANGLFGAINCPIAPRGCEACADRRGGAILYHWGLSSTAVIRGFTTVKAQRPDAVDDALTGWMAAKRFHT